MVNAIGLSAYSQDFGNCENGWHETGRNTVEIRVADAPGPSVTKINKPMPATMRNVRPAAQPAPSRAGETGGQPINGEPSPDNRLQQLLEGGGDGGGGAEPLPATQPPAQPAPGAEPGAPEPQPGAQPEPEAGAELTPGAAPGETTEPQPGGEPAPGAEPAPDATVKNLQKRLNKVLVKLTELAEQNEELRRGGAGAAPAASDVATVYDTRQLNQMARASQEAVEYADEVLEQLRDDPAAVESMLRSNGVKLANEQGQEDFTPARMRQMIRAQRAVHQQRLKAIKGTDDQPGQLAKAQQRTGYTKFLARPEVLAKAPFLDADDDSEQHNFYEMIRNAPQARAIAGGDFLAACAAIGYEQLAPLLAAMNRPAGAAAPAAPGARPAAARPGALPQIGRPAGGARPAAAGGGDLKSAISRYKEKPSEQQFEEVLARVGM